ncbi:sulfotransferase domain-containing protein [Sphingomonas sp. MMS24-J45]|uniref:sulfotransferase domain-containing protein n=1 Tax=Sphingomonas sp. MMS24-J45 TaxID=3238806 RepID=UPI00384EB6F8
MSSGRPGIIWLASYLKSGNTWMRLALASLRAGGQAVDINRFGGDEDTISASRRHFDTLLDIDSADLTASEIVECRAEVYRRVAATLRESALWKTHEACGASPLGTPLFPADATAGVVYLARDPRDVAVSLANHAGRTIDAAIAAMAEPGYTVSAATTGLPLQLPQRIGAWSENVESWLDHAPCPPIVVRYEDMRHDTAAVLQRVADGIGIPSDTDAIAAAVAATAFDTLRAQEDQAGFAERPQAAPRFFLSGTAGAWRDRLSPAQSARIERDHGTAMARLGYC